MSERSDVVWLGEFLEGLGGHRSKHSYPYTYAYALPDGGHVSGGAVSKSIPPLRVEFNPSHDLEETNVVLAALGRRRLTRLDIAVDYDGIDLNDYTFERAGVTRSEIRGRSGRVETVYLGRRSSAVYLRCYDKALEDKLEGLLRLRTEAQCRYRPDQLLSDTVFDKLKVRPKLVPDGLDLRDEKTVVWALNTPAWRQRLTDTRSRKRVDELLDAAVGEIAPTPAEVVRESWSEIAAHAAELTGSYGRE